MHWRKAPSGSDAVVFYFVVMALTASYKKDFCNTIGTKQTWRDV
jgi:hypothetical protein